MFTDYETQPGVHGRNYTQAEIERFESCMTDVLVDGEPITVRLDRRGRRAVGKRIQWKENIKQRRWNTGVMVSENPIEIKSVGRFVG